MLNDELIAILCCPETHQPISAAPPDAIESLNAKIKAGALKNRAGEAVLDTVDSALIRADKRFAYLIRNGIPILLIDQAVPLF